MENISECAAQATPRSAIATMPKAHPNPIHLTFIVQRSKIVAASAKADVLYIEYVVQLCALYGTGYGLELQYKHGKIQ